MVISLVYKELRCISGGNNEALNQQNTSSDALYNMANCVCLSDGCSCSNKILSCVQRGAITASIVVAAMGDGVRENKYITLSSCALGFFFGCLIGVE